LLRLVKREREPDIRSARENLVLNPPIPTADRLYFGRLCGDAHEREAQEDAFFMSLCLPNGTHKTTCRQRLTDLDELVERLLPRHRPLEIMDVAVSSGVSTVEWLRSLERARIACHLVAGDAVMDACLISLGRWLKALVDRNGRLLQLDIADATVCAISRSCSSCGASRKEHLGSWVPVAARGGS
jgi:hypothetical protein